VIGIEEVVQGQGGEDLLTIRQTQPGRRSVTHDLPYFNAVGWCPLYSTGPPLIHKL
jgi:hypothetical protein